MDWNYSENLGWDPCVEHQRMMQRSMSTRDLYRAIENNVDIKEFKKILSDGVKNENFDMSGALKFACELKRAVMVHELLPYTNERDKHMCFYHVLNQKECSLEIVTQFGIDHIDVNQVYDNPDRFPYLTPFLVAIQAGNEEIVSYLIQNGANVGLSVASMKPLDIALYAYNNKRNLNIVKILLENGGDINQEGGSTLFYIFNKCLVDENWMEVLDLSLKYGAHFKDQPFMCYAVHRECYHMIQYLIDSGLKASEEKLSNGHTALHLASGDAVEILLKWGSDVNAQVKAVNDPLNGSVLGYTPLHYACSKGDLEKIMTLLDYGANVRIISQTGVSVLFQLCDALFKDESFKAFFLLKHVIISEGIDTDGIIRRAENQLNHYTKASELLLAAGAVLQGKELDIAFSKPYVRIEVKNLDIDPEFYSRVQGLINELKSKSTQTKSLKNLCRMLIRKHLQGKKSSSVDGLSPFLPKYMIDFLKFRDIVRFKGE